MCSCPSPSIYYSLFAKDTSSIALILAPNATTKIVLTPPPAVQRCSSVVSGRSPHPSVPPYHWQLCPETPSTCPPAPSPLLAIPLAPSNCTTRNQVGVHCHLPNPVKASDCNLGEGSTEPEAPPSFNTWCVLFGRTRPSAYYYNARALPQLLQTFFLFFILFP